MTLKTLPFGWPASSIPKDAIWFDDFVLACFVDCKYISAFIPSYLIMWLVVVVVVIFQVYVSR